MSLTGWLFASTVDRTGRGGAPTVTATAWPSLASSDLGQHHIILASELSATICLTDSGEEPASDKPTLGNNQLHLQKRKTPEANDAARSRSGTRPGETGARRPHKQKPQSGNEPGAPPQERG